MQHLYAERIERSYEKTKTTRSPPADDEKLRQLELLLDDKLCHRFQRWCRACASEHCCMEKPSNETQEDHATLLQTLRNKRVGFENYIGQVDQLVNSCRYGVLQSGCLPMCDEQLPIWLYKILGVGFTLPLVPTFPTSTSAFEALCSGAGVQDLNSQLRDEYLKAASCARRLAVIGGEQLKFRHTRLTNVFIKEGVSQGYYMVVDVSLLTSSFERKEQSKNVDDSSLTKFLLETKTKILAKKDDLDKKEGYRGSILQKLESQMQWTGAYCCANAEIKECGRERALIVGQLCRSSVKESDGVESVFLPFKLILLLEGYEDGKVRVKGTFLRKSAFSRFYLRWKFNVNVLLV